MSSVAVSIIQCSSICFILKQKIIKLNFFQSKREPVDAWAAMWDNINKMVEKEMGEPEDTNELVTQDPDFKPKLENESSHIVIAAALDEIADELEKGWESVQQLADLMKSGDSVEALAKNLDMNMVARAMVQQNVCGGEKVLAGEWINICMSKITAQCEKTEFHSVNSLLKMILFKLVPYDMCFLMPSHMEDAEGASVAPEPASDLAPTMEERVQSYNESELGELGDEPTKGKHSKFSVGKYIVKSSKNPDGSLYWMCPHRCGQHFGSSRKCGAHLNEHLDHIYECEKCKFQTYSLDSYDHHKCFSDPKAHGPERRKYKHKSSGVEPDTPVKRRSGDKPDSRRKCRSGDETDSPVKRKSGRKSDRSPEKRRSGDQLSGKTKPSAALSRQEDEGVKMEKQVNKLDDNDIIVLE